MDLRVLHDDGLAIIVATADEQLRPEISRGWGPRLWPVWVIGTSG